MVSVVLVKVWFRLWLVLVMKMMVFLSCMVFFFDWFIYVD